MMKNDTPVANSGCKDDLADSNVAFNWAISARKSDVAPQGLSVANAWRTRSVALCALSQRTSQHVTTGTRSARYLNKVATIAGVISLCTDSKHACSEYLQYIL